ncbi:hypothetical protein DL769_000347 [Monosporascus sp. CRB-8-3]|nr:hypothetical protein DL769_000347 [Monosporascus sp. CRB-8-3]
MAMLQMALGLLGESRTETQWLKEAAMEQKEVIGKQQELIRKSARQLQATKDQIAEDLKQVREQLEAFTTRVNKSPRLSYAEVARLPLSPQPSNIRTLSTGNTTLTDTTYRTIDT